MLDRRLVEDVAVALDTVEGLVEKDWHVVRALGVLSQLDHGALIPVFSGGTSLSKGWDLIKRFSEDIDFKVVVPTGLSVSQQRKRRSTYRGMVLDALQQAGFALQDDLLIGNNSQFFSAALAYETQFEAVPGLRPFIRIEMTFDAPALPSIERPIGSLIAQGLRNAPEIPAFACIDPVETAADKLSALAWRACVRERGSNRDDPTIVRHIHDLAALEPIVAPSPDFARLLAQAAADDTGRGGARVPASPQERFAIMLERLQTDALWAEEYETYVLRVSYAAPQERIAFADALAAVVRLVETA